MSFKMKDEMEEPFIQTAPLKHVAIIMDGNGRWAKSRGLPRSAGHAAGAETFRTIATHCKNIGLDYLTVYAFSTENWKRPMEEVSGIIVLLEKYLHEAIEKMTREQIALNFFGDISPFPAHIQRLCKHSLELSKSIPKGFQVNLCINYGGRDEILRAAKAAARDIAAGTLLEEEFTQERFAGYLDSAGIPDPELVIRPSGELRLSNFLLWQSAYSEFCYSDTLWPDFTTQELDEMIANYQRRERRFGGVGS